MLEGKGSFKRYVTPEGEGEGVSVMLLRNVDKFFYMANQFHDKLTYRKLFFVLFNLKNSGIQVKIILATG